MQPSVNFDCQNDLDFQVLDSLVFDCIQNSLLFKPRLPFAHQTECGHRAVNESIILYDMTFESYA